VINTSCSKIIVLVYVSTGAENSFDRNYPRSIGLTSHLSSRSNVYYWNGYKPPDFTYISLVIPTTSARLPIGSDLLWSSLLRQRDIGNEKSYKYFSHAVT